MFKTTAPKQIKVLQEILLEMVKVTNGRIFIYTWYKTPPIAGPLMNPSPENNSFTL